MKYILTLILTFTLSFSAQLTQKEKQFLKDNPTINLGIGAGWEPIAIQKKKDLITGFDADILELVNKATNANFKLVVGNWNKIQERVKNKELHGLSALIKTPKREEFLLFTEPYNFTEYFIATTKDNLSNIKTKEDLKKFSISLEKGNKLHQLLVNDLDLTKVIYVDTAKNTFDVFFDGKTDLTIGMSGIKYELAKNNYPLLYDTNTYNKKTDLFMAVLKEYPEARSILQKGLDTITNEQFLSLRAKWQLDLNNNQSKNKEVSTLTKEEFVKVFINLINNTKDVVLHKDNAGGVSQEVLNKLFEPYFTTKFKSQGVGLSLFITKRIVTEKLNGQIKAEKNDKGLSYIIDINLD